MARPRVFISSTYYDLKHLRSSLENFVESLGFDALLSEKGTIAYTPDIPLDESCYREVSTADIFVLIVGGRYGSEASAGKTGLPKGLYDRYDSITRGEYRSAAEREVPVYVLVECSVYAEYETYLRNKSNQRVVYAHVDSVNIFELIEHILVQPRNNPVQQFDKYSDIETWLREQWAGLFRELLQRIQGQAQLSSLQIQVAQLAEINKTLKRYLEAIVSQVAPQESKGIIEGETKRLEESRIRSLIESTLLGEALVASKMPTDLVRDAATSCSSPADFSARLQRTHKNVLHGVPIESRAFTEVLNQLRQVLGAEPLPHGPLEGDRLVPGTPQTAPEEGHGSGGNHNGQVGKARGRKRRKSNSSEGHA